MIEGTSLDNWVHVITALLAFALFIVSVASYRRHRRQKFLYICAAFFLFSVKEIIMMLDTLFYHNQTLVGTSHLINFIVLILFFIGVSK